MKMIYNNSIILMDRLLSNGHQLLNNFKHLRAKIGLGGFRLCTPIDTLICNVCRCCSEVKKCKHPQ
jgi:hypothetical protein